jgi:hypothetical protein
MSVLGGEYDHTQRGHVFIADTLEDAALVSVSLGLGKGLGPTPHALYDPGQLKDIAERERSKLVPGQVSFRGLFCGGTYANESALLLMQCVKDDVHGNISLPGVTQLDDPWRSLGHTCVDMGEDVFTVGKPHPVLAPSLRRDRLMQEAADPSTGVILLDVILGYGTHPDPAVELATYIEEARALASEQGRHLPVIVNVCGVNEDPQDRTAQVEALRKSGAIVGPTNAAATRLAAAILTGDFVETRLPAIRSVSDAGSVASWSLPFELPKEGEVNVINDGLAVFAEALRLQKVVVTQVDFRSPARGDEELSRLLSEML